MAEAISVENTSGQLVCSICKNVFKEMTLSSCFHTFCLDCLRAHLKYSAGRRKQYECPICKTKINLPTGLLKDEGLPMKLDSDWKSKSYAALAESKVEFCDICEDGKPAINRCLQCQENFCYTCTNAHLKMKASRYHGQRVVPLGNHDNVEHSVGMGDPLPADQMLCPRHVNQEILFVCKKCDILLCNVCKLLEHESHVTRLVMEEASDVREKIHHLLERQNGFSEGLQLHLQMLSENGQQFPHALEHEILKVRNQASVMHADVERGKMSLERDLVKHFSSHMQTNDENCADVKRDYDEYVRLSKEAQTVAESASDFHVVRKGREVYDQLYNMEVRRAEKINIPDKPSLKFTAGNIQTSDIHKMVGFVSRQGNVPTRNHHKTVTFESDQGKTGYASPARGPRYSSSRECLKQLEGRTSPQSETSVGQASLSTTQYQELVLSRIWQIMIPFEDGAGYVSGIAPVGVGQAWVALLGHKHVTLVEKGGHVVTSVDVGQIAEDVASDGSGGCFVTCPGNKCIKHITNKGEVISIATGLTKIPHGISAARYFDSSRNTTVEELYVCFSENNDSGSSLIGRQKGFVKVISFIGEDLGKSVSLRAPVRVDVSMTTGSICISDHTHGCVMVTDRSGAIVKCLYTDEDDNQPFRPLGVCFDRSECILIADWSAGNIKRITDEGSLVQVLSTKTAGPQSIAIDNEGLLWVGGTHGSLDIYKME